MDLLYTDINFNSGENLSSFEHEPHLQSTQRQCSARTWILCLPSWTIASLIFSRAVTIRCLPTCSRSSRKSKHWQPANVSTPKSATVRGCNTVLPKPPQRSRVPSRTSPLTMISSLTFSAFVRTSSTLVSPRQCLFSMKTLQRLCVK